MSQIYSTKTDWKERTRRLPVAKGILLKYNSFSALRRKTTKIPWKKHYLIAFSNYDHSLPGTTRWWEERCKWREETWWLPPLPDFHRPTLPASGMMCISALSEITGQNRVYLNLHCEPLGLLASLYHKVQQVATDGWKARRGCIPGRSLPLLWKRRHCQEAGSHHTFLA